MKILFALFLTLISSPSFAYDGSRSAACVRLEAKIKVLRQDVMSRAMAQTDSRRPMTQAEVRCFNQSTTKLRAFENFYEVNCN